MSVPRPPGGWVDWDNYINVADISAGDLLKALERGIYLGSNKNNLCFSDFEFKINHGVALASIVDIQSAVDGGAPLLDAIYYFNAPNRPTTTVWSTCDKKDNKKVNKINIVRGVFCWFFSIFTQARHIAEGNPNFLESVMGLGNSWTDLIRSLSSADINKFPMSWIKGIDFKLLSEESRNRLALGAAGHRYTQALRYIRDSDWKDPTCKERAYAEKIVKWTESKIWWDLHPATKSSSVVTLTKSLNKTIEDCLVSGLTTAGLRRLTDAKILFATQGLRPGHDTWDTQDPSVYPPLTESIF